MGVVRTVGFGKEHFPRQGSHLNKKVRVCFFYDVKKVIEGEVVRDDMEEPFRTIIRLSDGRYIESSECQYSTD